MDEHEARRQQATQWHVRLTSGRVTEDERRRFRMWRDAHSGNDAAYRNIEELWRLAGVAYEESQPGIPVPSSESSLQWAVRWGPVVRWGWAAGLATLILVATWYVSGSWINAWRADYATAVGAQRTITLADGTVLHLNTDTAMNARWSADARRLELLQGEAIVTVAPDAGRPLILTAGPLAIRALGTEFDVQISGDDIVVTAIEHAVTVSLSHAREATPQTLEAGRRMRYSSQGFGPVESVALDRVAPWRSGRLIFEAQPLAEVVTELNRYRHGRIVIVNDALSTQRISAVFPLTDVNQAPEIFERTLALHVIRLTDLLVLLR